MCIAAHCSITQSTLAHYSFAHQPADYEWLRSRRTPRICAVCKQCWRIELPITLFIAMATRIICERRMALVAHQNTTVEKECQRNEEMMQRKKFIAFLVFREKHKMMRTQSRNIIIIIIVLSSFAKIPSGSTDDDDDTETGESDEEISWNDRNLTAMRFWC